MPHRLMDALIAMEERLRHPIDEESEEYKSLQETWLDVRQLLKELGDVEPN